MRLQASALEISFYCTCFEAQLYLERPQYISQVWNVPQYGDTHDVCCDNSQGHALCAAHGQITLVEESDSGLCKDLSGDLFVSKCWRHDVCVVAVRSVSCGCGKVQLLC